MKKLLLISVMAMAGLSASAQFVSRTSATPQAKSKVMNVPQTQRTFQAVAPRQDLATRSFAPGKSLTLDPTKVKPVTLAQRKALAQPTMQAQNKAFSKGMIQNRNRVNLQPTLTLKSQATSRAKAARKAPAFAETYTGTGVDYFEQEPVQWTMTPTVATYTSEDSEGEKEVEVLVDVIPTPSFLAEIYPQGIPVEYTVDEDNVVTILPQSVANYQDEENGTTNYITLFAANSADEDGVIIMEVNENGRISLTNCSWLCFGEFADVEFDVDMGDSDAFLGLDELITNVSYFYFTETTIDKEYNAHGVDYFANEAVDWVMQRGTTKMDDEETHFFVDMTPLIDTFADIYPNGIDVEYKQSGSTITVEPQIIAHIDDEQGTEYIMLSSGTSDDGVITLTEGENGTLKISDDESIIIGAWKTNKFDPSFETYDGSYSYIENIKYRLPDEPAEAPKDVACEPNELVLFAGLGYSGYSYNDNLAVMGAYAPTTFRNITMDIATDFAWSVNETDGDVETAITSDKRNFTLNTTGGAVYEDFLLTAYNQGEASDPYAWGTGHATNSEGEIRFEAIHAYAGSRAGDFQFSDGTYAVMTRQNPDYDLTFYVNWGTPNYADSYNISRIATIYSYQGKPATPLYLTGVTLPMVSFEPNDDFNLHIKLCKCRRSATGSLTLGDVIAEGDATMDNVNADYDAGITAVEFTELYKEDEFGMSETVDYLFIEDEFVIVIEGWDNGTFSGVLGSQEYNFNENTSTWFQAVGEQRLRSYGGGWPQLFIGLLDATYGYLHTDDNTNLIFSKDGGTSMIHVDPMYCDDETEEPCYVLDVESVTEDGEEVEDIPEWINIEIANEDYTTATETDEEGNEYEYFVNGIDYDMVVTVDELPEGITTRTSKIVYYQKGAKLTLTVTQDIDPDAISTVVEKTPIKNSRAYNMAGQPVGKNYKGIIVKDGKKVLVK